MQQRKHYFRKPAPAEVLFEFGSVCPSVCRYARQYLRSGSPVFKIFLHEVIKQGKWRSPIFGKKFQLVSHLYVLFYFIMKALMVFQLSTKTACLGKIWFLSYGPKISRPVRIQVSLNCNISQTKWVMKVNSFTWLEIYRSNKYSWSLQVGVVRHAWTWSKWWKIVSQLYLKNNLSY